MVIPFVFVQFAYANQFLADFELTHDLPNGKIVAVIFSISFSGSQQVNSRMLFTYWASHPDLLKVITYCWKLLHFTESHYILLKVITLYWKSLHFAESHYILLKVILKVAFIRPYYGKSLHSAESHYILLKVITLCGKSLHFAESHYISLKVITFLLKSFTTISELPKRSSLHEPYEL